MTRFSECSSHVSVTALLWCRSGPGPGCLLVGTAGCVHCYVPIEDKLELKQTLRVFEAATVHGFIASDSGERVLAYGSKHYVCLKISPLDNSLNQESAFRGSIPDWIWHVSWPSSEQMLFLTAHNKVLLRKFSKESYQDEIFDCEEKCILYAGKLLEKVVLSGTVFQEIIIWNTPDPATCHSKKDIAVLHRLAGHEGVIFALDYNADTRTICSTSDDRTARLWQVTFKDSDEQLWSTASIDCIKVIRNHSSRVFRCALVGPYLLTGGEDSFLNVWTDLSTTEPYFCKRAHSGSPIWAIAVDEATGSVYTGGGDGAVRMWPLTETTVTSRALDVSLLEGDPPTVIRFLPNRRTLCVLTRAGRVIRIEVGDRATSFEVLFEHESLRGYGLLEVWNSSSLVLASLTGEVMLLALDEAHNAAEQTWLKIHEGKIFSMHVLSERAIITCGPDGEMRLIRREAGLIEEHARLSLPKTGDQRWLSTAVLSSDSQSERLLVGDRNGYIHIYCITDETSDPWSSLKVHGKHGVGAIEQLGDSLFSTSGRDGLMKTVRIQGPRGPLVEEGKMKVSLSCLERFVRCHDNRLLLGFRSAHFVVYNLTEERPVCEIECGGSHRSWDFLDTLEGQTAFACIKDKGICLSEFKMGRLCASNVKSALHAKEVNTVHHFSLLERHFIATGGEDVAIKVHHITDSGLVSMQNVLNGHISSVKCIRSVPLSEDTVLLVSAGGRAQIVVWSITCSRSGQLTIALKCSYLVKGTDKLRRRVWRDASVIHDYEVRITDVQLRYEAHCLHIYAACSDGQIRLFKLPAGSKQLLHTLCSERVGHCLLRLEQLSNNSLISTSTDGFIRYWTLDLVLVKELALLSCGINSISLLGDSVAAGGDCGSIVINAEVYPCKHACQISGVHWLSPESLLTVSLDQRLSLWNLKNGQLNLVEQVCVDVADVQDMTVWTHPKDATIVVAGEGLALLKLWL